LRKIYINRYGSRTTNAAEVYVYLSFSNRSGETSRCNIIPIINDKVINRLIKLPVFNTWKLSSDSELTEYLNITLRSSSQ
jgi:hypothetical protein